MANKVVMHDKENSLHYTGDLCYWINKVNTCFVILSHSICTCLCNAVTRKPPWWINIFFHQSAGSLKGASLLWQIMLWPVQNWDYKFNCLKVVDSTEHCWELTLVVTLGKMIGYTLVQKRNSSPFHIWLDTPLHSIMYGKIFHWNCRQKAFLENSCIRRSVF